MRILMKVAKAKVPNLSKALKGLPKKSNGEFAKILARLKLLEKSSNAGEEPISKVAFTGMKDDPPLGVKGVPIAKEGLEEPKVGIRESGPSGKGRTGLPDEGKILESQKRAYIDAKEREPVIHLGNRKTAKNWDETPKGNVSFKEDLNEVVERPENTEFSKSGEASEIPEEMRIESKREGTEGNSNNVKRKNFKNPEMVQEESHQKTSKSRKVISGTHKLKEISMETVEHGKSGGRVHEEKRTKSQETRGHEASFSKTSQSEIKRDPVAEGKSLEEVSEVSKENTEIFEDESGDFKRSSHLGGSKAHGERQPKKFEHVERENVENLQEVPRRTISKTPKSGIGDRQEHRVETPRNSMKSNGFQRIEFRMTGKEKGSTAFERLERRRQIPPKHSKASGKTSKEAILEEKTSEYKEDSQKTVRKEKADGSHRSIFRSASERGSDGKRAEYEEHLKMDTSENNAYEESLKGKTVVSEIPVEKEEKKSEKPFRAFDKTRKNVSIKSVRIIGDRGSPVGKVIGEEMFKTPPNADGNTAEVIKESAGSVFKKTKKLKIERLKESASRTVKSSERTAGSVPRTPTSRVIDSVGVDDRPSEVNPHAVLAKTLKRELDKPVKIEREKRHADGQPVKADHRQVDEALSPKMEISTVRLNVESGFRKLENSTEKRPAGGEMRKFLDDVKVEGQFPEKRKKEEVLKVEKLEIVIEKKVRKAYGKVERGSFDEVFERIREMRRELEGIRTFALEGNHREVESAKVSIDEMIERIHRIVESLKTKPVATERARMELIPPDLGKVEVEIVKRGDELSVLFKVSTDEAKDLIERRIEILSHRLSSDGFNVERIEVRLERENDDELPEREEEKGQQGENHENEKKRKRREGEER